MNLPLHSAWHEYKGIRHEKRARVDSHSLSNVATVSTKHSISTRQLRIPHPGSEEIVETRGLEREIELVARAGVPAAARTDVIGARIRFEFQQPVYKVVDNNI